MFFGLVLTILVPCEVDVVLFSLCWWLVMEVSFFCRVVVFAVPLLVG